MHARSILKSTIILLVMSVATFSVRLTRAQPATFDAVYSDAVTTAIDVRDSVIAVGTRNGHVLVATDDGPWMETEVETGVSIDELSVCPDGRILAGSRSNSIWFSNDLGASWAVLDDKLPATRILHCEQDLILAAGSAHFVSSSTDNGLSWSVAILDTASLWIPRWRVGVDTGGRAEYIGYAGCQEFTCGGLYRIQSDGTWAPVDSWQRHMAAWVIEVRNADTVFVYGAESEVYRTFDGLASWKQDWPVVSASAVVAIDDSTTVAGTPRGLYLSRDGGGSFEQWALDDLSINDVARDGSGHLLVSTVAGLYRSREVFPTDVQVDAPHHPQQLQPFPNPFRDEVQVVAGQTCVGGRIVVSNASGQIVARVAAHHALVTIPTARWGSGVFWFRYSCEGESYFGRAIKL